MHRKTIAVSLMALFFLASVSAFGASGDKVEVKGMITSRTGETLIVKSGQGDVTVVLTDDTRTKDDKGLFGLEKQQMSNVVLMPGLKVDIDATSDDAGRFVASTITVDGDDLETAEMIEAGLHPTAEQVAANVQTLEAHSGQLATHKENIETNQQNIGANKQQIEQNIKNIEANTNRFVQLRGYIIEVTGFADTTGSAAINTKLSENRAKAVITFLMQQGNVPIRHIVAPGAMGEYGAAAPNETAVGRAQNRRVEVKVLVNKGIAGS
jgi:OmpA-OmpF porin, OOP family